MEANLKKLHFKLIIPQELVCSLYNKVQDYTILRQKINEKQNKVTLSNSPLSSTFVKSNNQSNSITPLQQQYQTQKYDQHFMGYVNESQDQSQRQTNQNKNFFIMQNSMNLEFMRQQLNFQQQLQQNLENIQTSSLMILQSSFEQQSLSYVQDFSQSVQSKALLQKHLDILKELAEAHSMAQNVINQYHSYLVASQFYRQSEIQQQPQKISNQSSGQIQFLKSIDEPQPSQNTKPIFSGSVQSQTATPQAFYQINSKNATPLQNKGKSSQTPSGKPRFINSKKQLNSEELYEDVSKDTEIGEYVNPHFLKVTRKSKVLYGRWFDKTIITLRMLYNMFSLYGNIEKMIYFKEKSGCLVQYFTVENAELAKESLTDVILYGQVLKMFYSNYEEIVLKQVYQGEQQFNQDSIDEYFQGTEENFRYKPKRNYMAAPPSDTLFLMNLNDELVQDDNILQYFQKFGNPISHKMVMDPNNKHQCMLKYESTEIALKTLISMHNIELEDRKISVAFSKERL